MLSIYENKEGLNDLEVEPMVDVKKEEHIKRWESFLRSSIRGLFRNSIKNGVDFRKILLEVNEELNFLDRKDKT